MCVYSGEIFEPEQVLDVFSSIDLKFSKEIG